MNLRMTVTAAVAGGLLWAQGAPAQVQEEAKKVLQQSADALLKLQSVEYTARRFGEGMIKIVDFTGDVRMIRSAMDKGRCPMLVKGHSKSLGPKDDIFWYTLDGNGKMTVVDADNQIIYVDRPLDQRILPMNQKSAGDQLLLDTFFSTEPYKNELTAETIELQPRQEFKGDMCDVVKSTRPLRGGQGKSIVIWYIAASDRLPRRQEQIVSMGEEPIKLIFELWNVKANAVKPAELKIDPPAGYKIDVFVPPPQAEPIQQPQLPPGEPQKPVPAPILGVERGNVPPDFTLKTADGTAVKRDDLAGSVTVLAFLWSRNTPSSRSIPVVEELKAKYKDNHLKVYGVMSHEKNDADGPKFLADNKATFPALLGGDDALNKAYKLAAFPSFYVIGADGKVVGFVQNSDVEAIRTDLTKLLQAAVEAGASAAK